MVDNRRVISRREFLKLIGTGSTFLLFGGLGFSRLLRSVSGLNLTNSSGSSGISAHEQQLGNNGIAVNKLMVNKFLAGINHGA